MIKFAIILLIYLASVFAFFFAASVVCRLVDWDTDMLVLLSFVWPFTLIGLVFIVIFLAISYASDLLSDKIEDFLYEHKRKRDRNENQ